MTRRRLDEVDYYELLALPHDADSDAVKAAFHAFARRYHPDLEAEDPQEQLRRTRIYQRGTEAYRVLSNPEQRRLYDAALADGNLRFDPSQARAVRRPTGPPGPGSLRTGKARPFLAKAEQALRAGDQAQARLNLQIALQHEPANPEIEARLAELERQRRGGG
jgi:curved DNA-binding protein CbpA